MLSRQALRDKAMQGMLDVLNDAGTKSEIKVTAGATLMDMLLKDAQLEQAEAQAVYYRKTMDEQAALVGAKLSASGGINSGRVS